MIATTTRSAPSLSLSGRAAAVTVLAVFAVLIGSLHCDLLVSTARAHHDADQAHPSTSHVHPGVADAGHEHVADPVAGPVCISHATQCLPQAVVPVRANDLALVLLVTLALTAIIGTSLLGSEPRRPRGPPGHPIAVPGRDILTRFCIARR